MASERRRWPGLGLKGKLAVAFGAVLVVLIGVAGAGIAWSSRLGRSIEVILRENFRSVLAAQDMKESLERMDSGALFALTGDPAQGRTLVETHAPRFRQALALELSNLTIPGERELAEEIAELFDRYEEALLTVLDTGRSLDERRAVYYGELLPRFQEIKRLADEILHLNQGNMADASREARDQAARARQQMVLALLLATVLALGCVVFLARSIVGPLGRLTASARRIEQGDYDLVLEPASRDEIGELAEAFNAMTRRLRALRRSDQARLAMAQRISQLTVNSLPDGVLVLDEGLRVELANLEARTVLGALPGEPLPEEHRSWVQPLVREAFRGAGLEARRGYERSLQLVVEGRERFFLPQAVPIRDAELGVLGATLILVDVTELKRLDAMKSDLVSTVSHELMTPLTSLAMALHIVLGERLGTLNREQSDLLVSAREDAERLQHILEGLLDSARLSAGAPLDLVELPAADLVAEAVEPLRGAFRDKGVALEVAAGDGGLAVRADRTRAALLLGNLLTNALKHTTPGGSVRIGARAAAPGRIELFVTDDGPGVPEAYRERIFERFFRLPGETERGAGLGLAIAREIAEAHGGRLWLDPEAGPGATFRVELPGSAPGREGDATP